MGNTEDGEQDRKENPEKKTEKEHRIMINAEADEAIAEVLEKVNRDFVGGQLSRSQLVNWVLTRFCGDVSADDIRAIRMDHINEMVLLEHYYRQAKDSGKIDPQVRELIRRLAGIEDTQKKGIKKSLQKTNINDDINENEGRRSETHS